MHKLAPLFLAIALALSAVACSSEQDLDEERGRAKAAVLPDGVIEGRVKGTYGLGLRVRAAPTTSSPQLTSVWENEKITITCQVAGESILGDDVWDYLEDKGGYVSDAYVATSQRGFVPGARRCDAAGAPPDPSPAPPSPPGPGVVTPPGPSDPPPGAGANMTVDISGPPVQPHVQVFANDACGIRHACSTSTYYGHQPSADLAIDMLASDAYGQMSSDGNAFGDALAEFAVANIAKYRIEYVIYRQRINFGDGWTPMEDRGSITQNHFDHVHVSFQP